MVITSFSPSGWFRNKGGVVHYSHKHISSINSLLVLVPFSGIDNNHLLLLDLGLECHEVVVGLPEVVHVAGDGVVGGQPHLEVGDDGGALLKAGQGDLDSLEPLDVVGRVGPDAVPLVQDLVQLLLVLGRLLGDRLEEVADLVDLGLVRLDVVLKPLVRINHVLQSLHVAGQRRLAHLFIENK